MEEAIHGGRGHGGHGGSGGKLIIIIRPLRARFLMTSHVNVHKLLIVVYANAISPALARDLGERFNVYAVSVNISRPSKEVLTIWDASARLVTGEAAETAGHDQWPVDPVSYPVKHEDQGNINPAKLQIVVIRQAAAARTSKLMKIKIRRKDHKSFLL